MKPISLLVFLHALAGGGAERFALQLLHGIDRSRFRPALVLSARRPSDYPIPEEVPVFYLDQLYVRGVAGMVCDILGLRRLLDELKPDIVYPLIWNQCTAAVLARGLSRHKPSLVLGVRNPLTHSLGEMSFSRWRHALTRLLFRRADFILTNSPGAHRDLVQNHALPPDRVGWMPNPVDARRVRDLGEMPVDAWWPRERPVVVACGRLVPQKNHELLIRAFSWVRQRVDSALVILGDGPERERLTALIRRLGMERDVFLPGFASNPYRFMARASVFALSSRFEGCPNVLLEAMALGRPVLTSGCPGAASTVDHGRSGLVAAEVGIESFAASLHRLLTDRELAQTLGAQARKQMESYHPSGVLPRYEALLEDIVCSLRLPRARKTGPIPSVVGKNGLVC